MNKSTINLWLVFSKTLNKNIGIIGDVYCLQHLIGIRCLWVESFWFRKK